MEVVIYPMAGLKAEHRLICLGNASPTCTSTSTTEIHWERMWFRDYLSFQQPPKLGGAGIQYILSTLFMYTVHYWVVLYTSTYSFRFVDVMLFLVRVRPRFAVRTPGGSGARFAEGSSPRSEWRRRVERRDGPLLLLADGFHRADTSNIAWIYGTNQADTC